MDRLIALTKDHADIGMAEIKALCKDCVIESHGNMVLVRDAPVGLEKRLAYAREVCSFLFSCSVSELDKTISSWNWNLSGSFAVRVAQGHKIEGWTSKKIGGRIFDALKNPKVNLENPDSQLLFYEHNGIVLAGLLESTISTKFMERRAHLRPALHPSSMHPRLAKACINLTGLKSGTIVDPFCGSGGLLIEAGLMGFNVIGIDILPDMLKRAKKNLNHYKIMKAKLFVSDAFKINPDADAIVTDLPYGKNTKSALPVKRMLQDFLRKASQWRAKKMVILFPTDVEPDLNDNWKKIAEFDYYLHKSLSKKILVLESKAR